MERRREVDDYPARNKKPTIIDHSYRVAFYSLCIAYELDFRKRQKRMINLAGKLHDIGKIYVPDNVLLKPEGLNTNERTVVERHALIGAELLYDINCVYPGFSEIIESHHENYDGTGYPHGLSKGDIPLGARIISVTDAFDAIVSNRPYNDIVSLEEALDKLIIDKGKTFDPGVVDIFVNYVLENEKEINQIISYAQNNEALPQKIEDRKRYLLLKKKI